VLQGAASILPGDQAFEVLEKARLQAAKGPGDATADELPLLILEVAVSNEDAQRLYLQKSLDIIGKTPAIFQQEYGREAFASRVSHAHVTPQARDELKRFLPTVEKLYDGQPSDAYAYLNMLSHTEGISANSEERKQFLAKRLTTGSLNQRIAILLHEESDYFSALSLETQERIVRELAQMNEAPSDSHVSIALAIACEKAQGTVKKKLVDADHCK
jgi:hypothetical protein